MRKEGKLAVCAALAALCVPAEAQLQRIAPFLLGQDPNAENSLPEIDTVKGTVLKLEGAHLLVGLEDGGVVSFDALTKKRRFNVPGDGTGPVADVILYGGQPWWVQQDSMVVKTRVPGISTTFEINLEGSELHGPIRRLSVWQQMIMVHGESGVRLIDPETKLVLAPESVMPPDVALELAGAVVTSSWKDGKGLLVAIKRYGTKKDPKPGELEDLGTLKAWSAEWRSPYRLLGSYTCDLVNFDATVVQQPGAPSGPSIGFTTVNTAALGNVNIGDEGIVALDYDEALTIPFQNENWNVSRVTPGVAPKYSQVSSYYNSDVWWAEGHNLMHASLEDGSTSVFVKRFEGEMRSLVADEEGVWILTDNGIKRLVPDAEEAPDRGFLAYELGEQTMQPSLGGQTRLSLVLRKQTQSRKPVSAKDSVDFVKQALKLAGISRTRTESIHGESAKLESLQYGDVIVHHGQAAFYVGDGQISLWNGEALKTVALELSPTARVYRFFRSGFRLPNGFSPALPAGEIGPVFPIGVAKPNPRLGHDLYVRVNPNSPFDGPHTEIHYRMMDIIEDWQGTPYVWGGSTRRGTDCSGFVQSVFREIGIELPRHSQTMARAPFGEVVFDELRFGDVLVYPYPKHVAIYIGNGRTAETVKGGVGYSNVWRRNRAYVRRFLADVEGGRWVTVQ